MYFQKLIEQSLKTSSDLTTKRLSDSISEKLVLKTLSIKF